VWLPRQIAKLSDIEGGPVQAALKSISFSLYRNAPIAGNRRAIAEQSWNYLPEPKSVSAVQEDRLSFFTCPEVTVGTRINRTNEVISALESVGEGKIAPSKAISTRYSKGITLIGTRARQNLIWELKRHT
jgi:hypothetical protein